MIKLHKIDSETPETRTWCNDWEDLRDPGPPDFIAHRYQVQSWVGAVRAFGGRFITHYSSDTAPSWEQVAQWHGEALRDPVACAVGKRVIAAER